MSQNIRVVAQIIAIPEKVDEVKAILIGLVEPTCQKAAFSMSFSRTSDDSADFTFVEEWTTAAALEAHLTSTHIEVASDKLNGLITTEPDTGSTSFWLRLAK